MPAGRPKPAEVTRVSYTVEQAAEATGVSRSKLFEEIGNGSLKSVKRGGRRLIRSQDLSEWLAIIGQPLNKEEVAFYEQRIERLGLSGRARNCLLDAGILTVAGVCKRSDRELLKIPYFGEKCLAEVRKAIDVGAPQRPAPTAKPKPKGSPTKKASVDLAYINAAVSWLVDDRARMERHLNELIKRLNDEALTSRVLALEKSRSRFEADLCHAPFNGTTLFEAMEEIWEQVNCHRDRIWKIEEFVTRPAHENHQDHPRPSQEAPGPKTPQEVSKPAYSRKEKP